MLLEPKEIDPGDYFSDQQIDDMLEDEIERLGRDLTDEEAGRLILRACVNIDLNSLFDKGLLDITIGDNAEFMFGLSKKGKDVAEKLLDSDYEI